MSEFLFGKSQICYIKNTLHFPGNQQKEESLFDVENFGAHFIFNIIFTFVIYTCVLFIFEL